MYDASGRLQGDLIARSIAVSVPAVGIADLLHRCLASAAQEGIAAEVVLVQNGPEAASPCADWEARGATIFRPEENLGVAASWNFMCRWAWERAHSSIVLLNEDVELKHRATLTAFAEAVKTDPDQLYFLSARGFSAVCLTRAVWKAVWALFTPGLGYVYVKEKRRKRAIPANTGKEQEWAQCLYQEHITNTNVSAKRNGVRRS